MITQALLIPLLHFSIVENIEILVSSGLHGFTWFVWLTCLDLHAPRWINANFIHEKGTLRVH